MNLNYAMPVRNMLYDSLAYSDQMKEVWNNVPEEERPKAFSDEFFSRFRKTDKICPVITLVIYFGESGDWDGSISIYEMFGENLSKNAKEKLKKYITDYKINLVEFEKISDVKIFKTDLRETIGMLQCKGNKEKLERYINENREVLSNLDLEASRIVRDVFSMDDLDKYVYDKNERKVADMCKALEDLKLSGIKEGEIKKLIEQISIKVNKGKEVVTIADELETDIESIQKIYDIVCESGPNYNIDEIYEELQQKNN